MRRFEVRIMRRFEVSIMRRFPAVLCAGVLAVACGDGAAGPPGMGSIALQLTSASGPSGAEKAAALESISVTVTGPDNKTATFQCNATCEGTIDGLSPGSYAVVVEGLIASEVDHFGSVSGVNVVAGQTATATIGNWDSFRPVLAPFPQDTTEVLEFPVSFSGVANATGYVLEWGQSASFAGATSVTLTGTSTQITVPAEALYFVRVRATNEVVTTGGAWSAAASLVALQSVATVTVTPATPTIAAGATQQFTAEARDANNNLVPSVNFFWSSTNHNVATVDQSGLATGVGGGSVTITAVGKGTPGGVALTVTPRTPTQLAFTVQAPAAVTSSAMSPAIQVEIRDATGARVTTARDPVTLAIGDNPPGNGRLFGTVQVNAVNGIATFSGISIDRAAVDYTLTASSGTLTGATSDPFTVTSPIVMYKDTPGWGNQEELVLANPPFNLKSGYDYWVRPMADLALGVPSGARVVILPSNAYGDTGQNDAERAAVAQTALDTFVRGGGWLMGHLADNLAVPGYLIPGLTGVADETTSCSGLTLTTSDHPLVFGPNEMAGGGDDLSNTNIDYAGQGCVETNGSVAGILPAGATTLITEQLTPFRPVYATYPLDAGRVVVSTITLEYGAGLATPTPTLRNSYYWVLRGAGAPVTSRAPSIAQAVGSTATVTTSADRWVSSQRRH